MDAYFAERMRVQRDYNERWFRLSVRLVPVLAVAVGLFILTGLTLTVLS